VLRTLIDGNRGAPPDIRRTPLIVVEGRTIKAVGPARFASRDHPGRLEGDQGGGQIRHSRADGRERPISSSSARRSRFIVRLTEDHYEDLIRGKPAQVTLKNGVTTVFDSVGAVARPAAQRPRSASTRGPEDEIGSRTFVRRQTSSA